ncbi:MAG: GNAT family N-acetyltransferase [Paracoccaceae bacterium]
MTLSPDLRLIRDWPAFLALERDWRDCHARASGSLFSAFDWLVAQQHAFGLPGALAFVTLWRDDRMVAAAPLVETRPQLSKLVKAYRPRALAPYGCKYTGFAEVLAETPADLDSLCTAILATAGRRVLDLGLLRQGEVLDRLRATCTAARRRLRETPAFDCGYIDLPANWDGYLAGRSRNFRKTLRKAQIRLEEMGGKLDLVPQFSPAVMARVLDVSSRSWKGTAGTGVGAMAENASFVETICTALAPSGAVDILFLTAQGKDIAFCITLRHGLVQYGLWTEFDEVFAEVSPGRLAIGHALQGLISAGAVNRFDLIRRTHFLSDFSDDFYSTSHLQALPALGTAAALMTAEAVARRLMRMRRPGPRKSVRRADVLPAKGEG